MTCGTPPVIGFVQQQGFKCGVDNDFYEPFQVINRITAAPIPVTGWLFFMDIYTSWQAKIDGDDPLIRLTTGAGFNILDADNGEVAISISHLETAYEALIESGAVFSTPFDSDVPQSACVYDMMAVDQNGRQRTRVRGPFIFQLTLSTP